MQKSNNTGSSETIRETNLERFCLQHYIAHGTPMHRPKPDIGFLEWFIGFFEAEGSFTTWSDHNTERRRFCIDITQKDPQLMYKIRTKLGFGRVTTFSKKDHTGLFAKYYVEDRKNLERLIYLFDGQFVTKHKQMQFQAWLAKLIQQRLDCNRPVYKISAAQTNQASFQTAWLAGFLEGDGGFWVSSKSFLYTKKTGEQSFRLKMKFYVTQEYPDILNQIRDCLGYLKPKKLHRLTNGHTSKLYYRFETGKLEDHLKLDSYLKTYQFLGNRSITLKRWSRLLNYRIYDYPVTTKSTQKIRRLIMATKNQSTLACRGQSKF